MNKNFGIRISENGDPNKPCAGGKNEKAVIRGDVYLALQRNSEKLSDHGFFLKGITLL